MKKFCLLEKVCIIFVVCAATAIASHAQTFTTLINFDGANGAYPTFVSLFQGIDGNFYGTTYYGGANGLGTVFKTTPAGTLTTLHSFAGSTTDGANPAAGLIRATNGKFYGTTESGGANGDGTVFKITPAGKLTTLYSFCAQTNCTDGRTPVGALVLGTDGNFYGITGYGGTNCTTPPWIGCGTVFKITPAGKLTTLYSFCAQTNCTDGYYPWSSLAQATDGNFYGTTGYGGANGQGTVFKITPGGTLTTLHSFVGTDGSLPDAGLVQGTDGNLYGTTYYGGANHDCIYGTCGTVFKITPGGTLTTLHSFDSTDGATPNGLMQATNGNFYGTTNIGGPNGDGTVFSLAMGLGPFVKTLPASGKVGAAVTILGNDLTGATAVSFDGTAATFTAKSTEITTKVPAGATTGTVKVTTASDGTLSSNVAFRVTPQLKSFEPTKGPVGTQVQITGVSLTQTTGVSFDGASATEFTVNSDLEVTATVPTGATTGTITITTAGGNATSKASFTVTK